MEKLRDRFWIWGHPTNSLYGCFGLNKPSAMSPVDGMQYLGATNLFYVPMGRPTDREKESAAMACAKESGWSIEMAAANPQHVSEIAALAKRYPNLKRGIFDDFLNDDNPSNNYLHYTPALLAGFRQELNAAGVSMWMVLYTKQLSMAQALTPYLETFDGISLWFWNEEDIAHFDRHLADFIALTPGKQRLLGCYLYDFGGKKPVDPAGVLFQLDRAKTLILQNKLEGVILHTNVVADMGFAGVQAAKDWLAEHGDEPIAAHEA